jgi:hypothetical protein
LKQHIINIKSSTKSKNIQGYTTRRKTKIGTTSSTPNTKDRAKKTREKGSRLKNINKTEQTPSKIERKKNQAEKTKTNRTLAIETNTRIPTPFVI